MGISLLGDNDACCTKNRTLFHDPLLEDPPKNIAPAAQHRVRQLENAARSMCLSCPFIEDCLYNAVAKYDVLGFCGGCTLVERKRIRRKLDISLKPESLGSFVNSCSGVRIDINALMEYAAQYPDAGAQRYASYMGCSVSTVRRHLNYASSIGGDKTYRPAPTKSDVIKVFKEEILLPQLLFTTQRPATQPSVTAQRPAKKPSGEPVAAGTGDRGIACAQRG